MKKRIISLIIMAIMLLGVLPLNAFAATKYNVWVAGKQITSQNAQDLFGDGTVSFMSDTNTLVLNAAEVLKGYPVGDIYCGIYSEGDLNIELKGKTRIYLDEEEKYHNGIRVLGDINIKGDGELHVRTRGDYAKGIWAEGSFYVNRGVYVYAAGLGGKKAGDSGAVWAKDGIAIADKMVESFEYSKIIEYFDENENEYFYVFSPDKETPSLRVNIESTPIYYSDGVDPEDTITMHRIFIRDTVNGNIKVNGMALVGSEVRVEFIPDRGYTFESFYLKDTNMRDMEVTDRGNGVYSFTMPDGNVNISAKFVHEGETYEELPFADVNENEWYSAAVRYVYENGLIAEELTDKFYPGKEATRAMIVSMLWMAEGMPWAEDAGFSDIKDGTYYKKAVDWAKATGVSVGYGSTFGPDDSVTREQMVSMLYRYAVLKGIDVSVGENTNILSFEDAFSISEYAFPAMQWACGSGIISGDGAVLFPQGTATRAQLSQVMMMILN